MGLTRRRSATALLAAALAVPSLVGCGSTDASTSSSPDSRYGEASAQGISLSDGWATEAPKAPKAASSADPTSMSSTMSSVGGAYFTLANDTDSDDALVAVSTPAAGESQLHTTQASVDGSSGTMKRVSRIDLPAGGRAELRIGGEHVMLVAPTRALTAGERISMRLTFASGTVLDVRLPVLEREDRPQ